MVPTFFATYLLLGGMVRYARDADPELVCPRDVWCVCCYRHSNTPFQRLSLGLRWIACYACLRFLDERLSV